MDRVEFFQSLPARNSTKPFSSFKGKTYLFTRTASELDNVKAWKMTERLKINPSFEAGKL